MKVILTKMTEISPIALLKELIEGMKYNNIYNHGLRSNPETVQGCE